MSVEWGELCKVAYAALQLNDMWPVADYRFIFDWWDSVEDREFETEEEAMADFLATLSDEKKEELRRVARWMKEHPAIL